MKQLQHWKPKQLESAVASVTPEVCFYADDMVPPSFCEILSCVKQTLVILVGIFLCYFLVQTLNQQLLRPIPLEIRWKSLEISVKIQLITPIKAHCGCRDECNILNMSEICPELQGLYVWFAHTVIEKKAGSEKRSDFMF